MWLVNQALRQPYLVYVGILLTCILGGKLDNIYDAIDELGTAAAAA